MSQIFISHSSRDNDHAIAVRDWLVKNNWNDIFLDFDEERGIIAGQRWQSALKMATKNSQVVLFLITPNWLKSDWSRLELIAALSMGKALLAVIVEPVDLKDLPSELIAEYQVADLTASGPTTEITIDTLEGQSKTLSYATSGLRRLFKGLQLSGANADFFAWPPEEDPHRSPYRGLDPLTATDAGIYFGRASEIANALSQIRNTIGKDELRHFVVIGASGSGKSSFVAAGLLPRLARETQRFFVLDPIRPDHVMQEKGSSITSSLAKAHETLGLADTKGDIRSALKEDGNGAAVDYFKALMKAARERHGDTVKLVVTIDQAETLYSPHLESGNLDMRTIIDALTECLSSSVFVIFSIRSPNFQSLQHDEQLAKRSLEAFPLGTIPPGAYKEIIMRPAERYSDNVSKLEISPDLVSDLLNEIDRGGSQDTLPLLAYTLRRLFDNFSSRGEIVRDDYRKINGLKGSIDDAIASALNRANDDPRLPNDHSAKLALLKRGLIPWTAGIDPVSGEPRRNVANLEDIPEESRPMLELLVEERLLTVGGDPNTGLATIEPAHEAFLRCWTELNGWLQEDRPLLATLDVIRAQALIWSANNKTEDRLSLRADALRDAERLVEHRRFANQLTTNERAFIEQCGILERAEIGKRTQATRIKRALALTAALAVIGAGIFGWQWQQAQVETAEIRAVEQARILLETDRPADAMNKAMAHIAGQNGETARNIIAKAALKRFPYSNVITASIKGAFQSEPVVFNGAVYSGLLNGELARFNLKSGRLDPVNLGEPAMRDNPSSNTIVRLSAVDNKFLAVLFRSGQLKFYDEKFKLVQMASVAMRDTRPSHVRIASSGRIWAVPLGNQIAVTHCAPDKETFCNTFLIPVDNADLEKNWIVGPSGEIRDLRIVNGRLEHRVFIKEAAAPKVDVLGLPEAFECSIDDLEIIGRKGIFWLGSEKCAAFGRLAPSDASIVVWPGIRVAPNAILHQEDAWLIERYKEKLRARSLEEIGPYRAGTILEIPLPADVKRLGGGIVVEKQRFAVFGLDQQTTHMSYFDIGVPVRPGHPMANGGLEFQAISARGKRAVAHVPGAVLVWNIEGSVDFDTQGTSDSFSNFQSVWSAGLEDGSTALLLNNPDTGDKRLVILGDGQVPVQADLLRRTSMIMAHGNDVFVIERGQNWISRARRKGTVVELVSLDITTAMQNEILQDHGRPFGGVISPDGATLYISHTKGSLLAWPSDLKTSPRILVDGRTSEGRVEGASSLSLSADGAWLATSDNIGAIVYIYPVNADALQNRVTVILSDLPGDGEVRRVAFSPSGNKIAYVTADARFYLYEWRDEKVTQPVYVVQLDQDADQHSNVVTDMRWVDDNWIAVSGRDRTVRMLPADVRLFADKTTNSTALIEGDK